MAAPAKTGPGPSSVPGILSPRKITFKGAPSGRVFDGAPRHLERAMALLRRGDLSVTEVCFAVGCSSLGTFSSRFTELVGMPPPAPTGATALATAGMPSCVRNR